MSSIPIPYKIRNQHIYIPGKTRHGKSTMMHAMAYQDIMNGYGVCVIDPKGDLVDSLVHWVPTERINDCIYIEPHHPIPIDLLDYANAREKQTLIGELKFVITKNVNAEGAPLMNAILNDVIYTILEANENGLDPPATFLDIHDFLALKSRKDKIMKYVNSPRYQERWDDYNFPNPKDRQPTLTRMNNYVTSDYLAKAFGCPKPELNLARAMDEQKILLVNLGGIDEPSKLFATLLIAKIRQAAFRRASIPEPLRTPFHLYVDEFEFFQTSDFEQILSFAGGYGLRLTLANQFIGQLDTNIKNSVLGNVGSFIIFCVSQDDARHFKSFAVEAGGTDSDLANLPKYQALYKIAGAKAIVKSSLPPAPPPTNSHADYIKKRTLDLYSCKPASASHNSGDGTKPDPEPTLPHDAHKEPGPPAPQRVLRPHDKPARQATKRSDSH